MDQIKGRFSYTQERIQTFQSELAESKETVEDKACIYATGSYGRLEASKHSDLDVFIISLNQNEESVRSRSKLDNLSEILVKADLVHMTKRLQMRDFDADGKYLTHYPLTLISDKMGTPDDDVLNTFFARLLLLLESKPIVEDAVYFECIDHVLAKYWRDFSDHKDNFVPAFLTNDILRLWRTLCVNYRARTKTEPSIEKNKRKLKNYKLKYSRLLTCFSTILYLIGQYRTYDTVSTNSAKEMVRLTPLERLSWVQKQEKFSSATECIGALFDLYESFTDAPEGELVERFADKRQSKLLFDQASEFGDKMAQAIDIVGGDSRFRRMLIV